MVVVNSLCLKFRPEAHSLTNNSLHTVTSACQQHAENHSNLNSTRIGEQLIGRTPDPGPLQYAAECFPAMDAAADCVLECNDKRIRNPAAGQTQRSLVGKHSGNKAIRYFIDMQFSTAPRFNE